MDFVGPLPLDDGFNCILSITDHLGAGIHIISTCIDIAADELALLFFDHWYCENGLPNNIICNHNRLFVSKFWKVLTRLTGVSMKMSTVYHPKTNGSS